MTESKAKAKTTAGSEVSSGDLVVRADPDKRFFIENLVKDIELVPAILDLVDNSVDSARALALARATETREAAGGLDEESGDIELPEGTFAGLRVDLTVGPEVFEISDNCGGMSLDVARRYAFRFGRPSDFDGVPGSVGEFGVGMKRALFKLGRWFQVKSRCEGESFDLEVDVNEWADDDASGDWHFAFKSALTGLGEPSDEERGTEISVKKLHASVAEDFANDLILTLLREQLRLRHQVALDLGLQIRLNGERLRSLRPALLSGPTFQPIRRSFVIHESEASITVEVIAGIVASDRKDADRDASDGEAFKSQSEAGWWVFCNNRLLLVADKSSETGWGNGAAAYHPQYRLFRGYVYISSLDPSLLPWNTTKTGVDSDSRVWRKVQTLMLEALAEVQAVINRMKKEREEMAGDETDDGSATPFLRAFGDATSVRLRDLKLNESHVVPEIPKRRTPPRRRLFQKIQYEIPRDQFEATMDLGFPSAADLGRRTFEYFFKREVEGR